MRIKLRNAFLGIGAIFAGALLLSVANSAEHEKDFKTLIVDKRVREYPNRYDLGTPLDSFVTFKYLMSEGKRGAYRSVNSYRIRGFFPRSDASDSEVQPQAKERILQTHIKEIIVYKDAVAGVITEYSDPMCIITYLSKEEGRWLNAGEGFGNDLNDARKRFADNSRTFVDFIDRIRELKRVPPDPRPFFRYLRDHGRAPNELILDALARHSLVIYGEIHRRKASWDLLNDVLHDPAFAENVGTVFLELSADKQEALNAYFRKENLDPEIILGIFRDVQIDGWYDKGMFDFLEEAWKLNKRLSPSRQLRYVAVDEPRPFSTFTNKEDLDNHFKRNLDRNEQMAKLIYETKATQKDKRNSLFIVGIAHAYKSSVPGVAGGKSGGEARPTAAAQLSKLFSHQEVFSIFQHGPIIGNDGTVHGRIRNGLFDKVFAESGNKAVAFNLKDSPFGKEPFDGIYEISYNKEAGSLADNYDAYLFLGPLESEPGEYLLYEVITDVYVKELTRRAQMTKASVEKWFGVDEPTTEAILAKLKSRHENKKRWPDTEK